MKLIRSYTKYTDYIEHQKKKTNDPVRRKKWLNDEWNSKLEGFMLEFQKLMQSTPQILCTGQSALCLGARTGQEVKALLNLQVEAIGIDLVPCEPLVLEGDIHDLDFPDSSFDFVFTNIIDHTIYPEKMVSEIERVLKPGGHFFLQLQAGIQQDEFTEYEPSSPSEIIELFNKSQCIHADFLNPKDTSIINVHGMNFEMIFKKN